MNLDYFKNPVDFYSGLQCLFKFLNIPVNYIDEKPLKPQDILSNTYKDNNPAYQLMGDVYILGMVDDKAFANTKSEDISEIRKLEKDYDGILIFGVTLKERKNGLLPTRTQLAEVTRAFNREFYYTPVAVVFRYESYISLASAQRLKYKQEWREGEKAGKVSILRDIEIKSPHAGHIKILEELKITRSGKKGINTFDGLYQYWQEVVSVSLLSKKFYQELSNWYFWAIKHVAFPSEPTIHSLFAETGSTDNNKLEAVKQEFKAQNVIRLLTRLLFVWFIKEKKLIPEDLFDLKTLQKNILKRISPFNEEATLFKEENRKSIYYKAILQNLFFATLNCPVKPDSIDTRERGFRGDESYGKHRGVDYLMRYKKYFKNPDAFLEMVNKVVPFLNGGLFECLDDKDKKIYIDGFSDNMSKTDGKVNNLIVPDYLFFGREEKTDLSSDLGVKNKGTKEASVKGLINILKSYKFTIAENTPIEEDVALDPELLGKVFENLLASYNPETKTTARKQTGSFYTPREIVNYMVDESLIAHLKNSVPNWDMEEKELDEKLHELVSFEPANPFKDDKKFSHKIIHSLDNCKILDPACGSGAFPMGILQKMVHILQKVDPDNEYWQDLQLEKAQRATEGVFVIKDKEERGQLLIEINEAFDETINNPDYARKLFLIENCIYGVDIQPIAAQISKLRFFISLVVEQKVNKEKDNFGIRPLPNLETKFVTANTLIGIEKPEQQLSLFDSKEVKKLEQELKTIRHKLFGAKTKATKVKYRKRDEELRNEIAEELKKSGWGNKSAEQLASWDPYDQNGVSPFFDPEWMFDIKDGFDVVIGNPPYKILTKNNTEKIILDYFLTKYYSIKKSSSKNLYTIFIENSINLLKKNSHLSFIVPEGLFQTRSYSGCVEFMEKKGSTKKVVSFTDFVFENAVTGNIIFLFHDNHYETTNHFHFDKFYNLSEKEHKEQIEIAEIEKGTVKLDSISTSFKGMVVKDRSSVLYEEQGLRNDAFLLGKNIAKWRLNSSYFTDYENLTIIGGTKKIEKHNHHPRILIRRTGNTLCCAYLDEPALTESTLYSLWSIDSSCSNFYILGLLNTKVLDYYNKSLNITNQQGFPQILLTDLKLLPIKKPVFEYTIKIEILTLMMLFDENEIINHVLNAIVFELYFPDHMKERKIDVLQFVEKDIDEVMHGKEFETLNDTQKEQVITELHARWSDPDCEIVKRMNSFPEKSPEILKPILEG